MIEEGQNAEGNFHIKEEDLTKSATTEGHFAPLFRRVEKVASTLDDIINYQNFEREKEGQFKDYQTSLYSSFFNMTMLELVICAASAGYSVYSLRQFFVKKAIY